MTNLTPQKSEGATVWRLILTAYWLALFVSTHLPSKFPGLPGDRVDKLVHAAAFAVLAWLLATAWQSSAGELTGRHLRFAWLAVVLYGVADEVTQIPVGRTCSLADGLADAIGAAVGLVVFAALRRRKYGK